MEILMFGALASAVISLLRSITFILDGLIFGLAGLFYKYALSFININDFINTSDILSRFSSLVYSFLAIVMFFKVAFSLLQMLVDPTAIEDKQKGAGTLIKNIVLTLVLIVFVPIAFDTAMNVQSKIVEENLIEKAIYGEVDGNEGDLGSKFARATWGVFLRPAESKFDINIFVDSNSRWNNVFNISNGINDNFTDVLTLFGELNSKKGIIAGGYEYTYIILISTIAAVYVCWTFIKLSIDFAYRALKMFLLQLISPIAIVSFMDPKSSKDGIFAKWLKETMKTYLSLFIRLVCFAIAGILMNEFSTAISKGSKNIFYWMTYLLAVFAFVKNAPKIIDGILGTELSKGSETKFATDMLRAGFGAVGGAAVGLATGGILGAKAGLTGVNLAKQMAKGGWSGASKGFTSARKGDLRGVVGAYTGTYGDVRKKLGFDVLDKDHQRDVKGMESTVSRGESAKSAAVKGLNATQINSVLSCNRNKNNKSHDFSYLQGDAVAEGEVIKYISTVATNSEQGLNNKEVYNKEAIAKRDSSIASRMKNVVNAEYERRIKYTTQIDKETQVLNQINAERRSLNQSTFADVNIAVSTVGTSIDSKFNDIVENDIVAKTGRTTSEWENISGKYESDAKDASKAVEDYEKTEKGIMDKRTRALYSEAKRKKEAGY